MKKKDVIKWYSAMIARIAFTMVLVAFYSSEFFTSVI
jgi:hypothetical protein